jgi:phosphohistidine phosphatase SixA
MLNFDTLPDGRVSACKNMKTLFIMRHAKSSWDDPDLSDFERPLNNRGLKTVPFMGEVMTKNDFTPEIIVSSPAMRARQTAELVKNSAAFDAEIRFDERIYEASPLRLLEVVSDIIGRPRPRRRPPVPDSCRTASRSRAPGR